MNNPKREDSHHDGSDARSLLTTLEAMESSMREEGDEATADALAVLREDVDRIVRDLKEDHTTFRELTVALLASEGRNVLPLATKSRQRLLRLEQTMTGIGEEPAPVPEPDEATVDAMESVRVPKETWRRTLDKGVLSMEEAPDDDAPPPPRAAAGHPASDGNSIRELVAFYNDPSMRARLMGVDVVHVDINGAEPAAGGVYVAVKDGGWIADEGHSVTMGAPASDEALAQEIAVLVAIAHAKGWKSVKLEGTDKFVQHAALALHASGIAPKCAKQFQPNTNAQHAAGPSH